MKEVDDDSLVPTPVDAALRTEGSDPQAAPSASPWTDLDAEGSSLTVDAFITTLMSQVGNALRRILTVPYATQFGLTVSQWRVLSLIAHGQRISFSELVAQSTSDKALVSRALKQLNDRGLVRVEAEGRGPRRKKWCFITSDGAALHHEAIAIARARQATAIRVLPLPERDQFYRSLIRLKDYCQQHEAVDRTGDDVGPLDI